MSHWNIKHKIAADKSRYFNNSSFNNQQFVWCLSRHLYRYYIKSRLYIASAADISNPNCSYPWIILNSTKQILKFTERKTFILRVFIKSDFHIYKLVIFPFLHI